MLSLVLCFLAAPATPTALELVRTSAGLPVEFHADIVFRLQDQLRAENPKEWIQTLTNLVGLADTARMEAGFKAARWARPEGWESILEYGSSARLDRASIKLRAIELLARVQPSEAMQLLSEMGPPKLAQAACGSTLVQPGDPYFDSLGRLGTTLLQPSASPETRRAFLRVVEDSFQRLNSPTELAPALRLLAELPLPAEEWRRGVLFVAGRMASLRGSDRDFAYSFSSTPLAVQAGKVLELAAAREAVDLRPLLLNALVRYVTAHWAGPACEPFALPASLPAAARAREPRSPVEQVNDLIARHSGGAVEAIDASRLPARQMAGRYDSTQHPPVSAFPALLVEVSPFRPNAMDQKSPEWRRKVEECLKAIQNMKARDQPCPRCFLSYRAGYLATLLECVKSTDLYEAVAAELVHAYEDPSGQQDSPAAWAYSFEQNLNAVRAVAPESQPALDEFIKKGAQMQAGPHAQGAVLLQLMRASNDRVVSLYAQVESAFPKAYDLWWTRPR
jgi:hypothetical protein